MSLNHRSSAKKNTFFGGAAILAMGIMIVKLIGMFYRIPLMDIIGEQGAADFSNAYNIYAVLLTISTTGLPVAVSKLVSEANALGKGNQVKKTFKLALSLFLILGVLFFLVMFFWADGLAGMMNDEKAAAGIRALAPAVICVGCLSAFRGYTQGHSNMTPTAVSQIIEALCKLVIGLALADWLINSGKTQDIAAAGAITGVTIGTVVALVYMIIAYIRMQGDLHVLDDDRPEDSLTILKKILRIAVPITITSSMVGIVTVIDSSLVQGQLQKVLLENPESWKLYAGFVDMAPLEVALMGWKDTLADAAPTAALLKEQVAANVPAAVRVNEQVLDVSRILYGNYATALNIYNLPTSLMAAITASVIPAVSGALARRDKRETARITGSALRITALLAFPMGVGLFVLGTPIIQLLFPAMTEQLAGPLLSYLGIATLFVCMMLVCNSILQAHGFVNLPVAVMVLGGVLKILTNFNTVVRPGIGIYGAPFGNVMCFGLCMALDLIIISRVIPGRPSYLPIFLKPAVAAGLMGLAAWAVNGLATKGLMAVGILCEGDGLSRMGYLATVGLAICVAVVVYGVLVLALRAISREDLKLMPKGDKIAKILRIS